VRNDQGRFWRVNVDCWSKQSTEGYLSGSVNGQTAVVGPPEPMCQRPNYIDDLSRFPVAKSVLSAEAGARTLSGPGMGHGVRLGALRLRLRRRHPVPAIRDRSQLVSSVSRSSKRWWVDADGTLCNLRRSSPPPESGQPRGVARGRRCRRLVWSFGRFQAKNPHH